MNGKYAMKDMAEFFRQRCGIYKLHCYDTPSMHACTKYRAVLEDIYAKGLLKLSKSTLGNMEEG